LQGTYGDLQWSRPRTRLCRSGRICSSGTGRHSKNSALVYSPSKVTGTFQNLCLEEFHSTDAGPLAHGGHAGRRDDEHGMRRQQQQHERPFHSSCVPTHAQADTHKARASRQSLHVRVGGLQLRVCSTPQQRGQRASASSISAPEMPSRCRWHFIIAAVGSWFIKPFLSTFLTGGFGEACSSLRRCTGRWARRPLRRRRALTSRPATFRRYSSAGRVG
jgi:hypothetical protein